MERGKAVLCKTGRPDKVSGRPNNNVLQRILRISPVELNILDETIRARPRLHIVGRSVCLEYPQESVLPFIAVAFVFEK